MASSLVSTGVKFPDDTIQTTAAGAGGSSLEAVASGSLSDGSTVIVNSDGTVSVAGTITQSVGTPVVFETADTDVIATTFDSINNKVVIAYRDVGNSSYGTAIVGTVSGTNISFGTAVVYESASTDAVKITFDSTSGKVVISYKDDGNSGYGTAIVGTVSGTSISFGTAVVYASLSVNQTSITFDSTNSRAVIAYRDSNNSNYGTAIVGTVSGTSISFGTAVVFESGNTISASLVYDTFNQKIVIAYRDADNTDRGTAIVGTVSGTSVSFGTAVVFENGYTTAISSSFDSVNNKVVISYQDFDNSSYGTAIVGTVSGTSISFGSAVVFETANTSRISSAFDSTNNKTVIAYRDVGNSNYGTLIVGTVSGNSISFGTAVVFEAATTDQTAITFDSANNKMVISYRDEGNSNYGTSIVFQNESTNLTSENFIGISDGAYTNGQTATVQLLGSVDDAQSGLTAGQKYYVQGDGTLSLTPDTPSVLAGTAVSATELIIKR